MQAITPAVADKRYAKCIEVSKRIRWDIDRDVIRDRGFDMAQKFLPDGLSFAERLPFLDAADKRLLSQVQGRTYANMFGLVERFIGAKMLEVTREHALGEAEAVGEELLRHVKAAVADDVAVDVPADPLRHLDAFGVALVGGGRGDGLHDSFSWWFAAHPRCRPVSGEGAAMA